MKDAIQITVEFRATEISCIFLQCTKHRFEGQEISCTKTTVYQYFKKLIVLFPWRVINWHVLQKNKAIFTSVVRFINSAQAAHFVVMFTKSLNKAYKKDCVLEFQISVVLHMDLLLSKMWTRIYLQKAGISKHSWWEKII